MRYIDISKLNVSKEWKTRARKATAEARAKSGEARKKFINESGPIWGALKDELEQLSHGKCWYTECLSTGFYFEIDHFRPKNAVRTVSGYPEDCLQHPGYWWCAFSESNFRLSCKLCNTNKGDFFPLENPSRRAKRRGIRLSREKPALLDPCREGDPCLLTFADDGRPTPAVKEAKKPEHKRARVTIERLRLDDRGLVDARRYVCGQIKSLIEDGDWAHQDLQEATVPAVLSRADDRLAKTNQRLQQMMDRRSPFSAFAIAVIRGFRDRTWLKVKSPTL